MDGQNIPFFRVREGLGETEADIVRHASCLFGTLGYKKTNIGDIAERMGMSPGNLYRYYKNKQAIGEEVVRCYMNHTEAQIAAAVETAGNEAEARLRAVFASGIGGLLEALRENPRMVELADMICEGNSGVLATHIEWKLALFAAIMRDGDAQGLWRFHDADTMAQTLLDATRGFWYPTALAQIDPAQVPERVDRILDAFMAGWHPDRVSP